MLEMFSREGECVRFETPVDAKGNVEVWLQRLVDGMQASREGRERMGEGVGPGRGRCSVGGWI